MASVPSFFVVGAQKAGTTTLHSWFERHPEVCLPTIKETHFFQDDERFAEGLGWYLDWFKPGPSTTLYGEVDPEYMFSELAAARIRDHVAEPRCVFVFRQPVERAFSQYQMSRRRGFDPLPFADALVAERERLRTGGLHARLHLGYMARGRYAEQVARFRKTFGAEQLLCVKFDDLFSPQRGRQTYETICRFVGITSQPPADADWSRRHNPASEPRWVWLRDAIYGPSVLKRAARLFVRSERAKLRVATWVDHWNRRAARQAEPWRAEVPRAVWEEANDEVRALAELTGLTLDDWIVHPGA